jgi:hypothetical protein
MWKHVGGFVDYASRGAAYAGGLEPKRVGPHGMTFTGFLHNWNFNSWNAPKGSKAAPFMSWARYDNVSAETMSLGQKLRKGTGGGANLIGPGMSAYFVYKGYKEGGAKGAWDAAWWDIAVSSATVKHAFVAQKAASKLAAAGPRGLPLRGLGLKGMARGVGAGIGAEIGQQLGNATGLPFGSVVGAFAGASVGAAPLKFAASHPILIAGAAGVVGAVGVGFGGYQILKAGHRYAQRQRGIDTSGSLAAFITQNTTTMRSRAVQAMQRSHMNARSALGQEASFFHQPQRNYHSRYRM